MKTTGRKLAGSALLWLALGALVYSPSAGGGVKCAIIAVFSFVTLASGLALFADALKRDIVEQLRNDRNAS